jgi:ATP-dependent HslUV protease subunit HslV
MTTILAVRRKGEVAIAGDGQVSMGQTISKGDARKVRRIANGEVVTGFAGATADAFTLLERLDSKLEQHRGQLMRACVELAKDWRTDRYLRRLEALMIVADRDITLMLSGLGDVIEPEALEDGGVVGIGSGGNFAAAAAKALYANTELGAAEIARKSLEIAAGIDVYTNDSIIVETIG